MAGSSRRTAAAIGGGMLLVALAAGLGLLRLRTTRRPVEKPPTVEAASTRLRQALSDLADAEQHHDEPAEQEARARVREAEQQLEQLEQHRGAPAPPPR